MNVHSYSGVLAIGERPSTADMVRAEALRLFASRGYAAVSMREIADAVGIRAGGIYNHFATKQDILKALMTSHMAGLIAAWREVSAGLATPEERLTAFARFHIRYHFKRPDAVFVSYMELRNLEPQNFTIIEEERRTYEGFLRRILEDGAASGALTVSDAAVETRALIAMLTGVTTWYRPGGRLSIAEIEDIYVGLARRGVGLAALKDGQGREPCSTVG